jgi:hypothetical protein
MGEDRQVYKVLVGKTEGKRPLGLGKIDWIRLAQDRDWWRAVVRAVMNLRGFELVTHVAKLRARHVGQNLSDISTADWRKLCKWQTEL